LIGVVASLSLPACRGLNVPDGSLVCSESGHCPSPYVCNPADNRCYRQLPNDASMPIGGAGGGGADAAVDRGGDGTGVVVNGKQPEGNPCGKDADCTSTFCRDGVCCHEDCSGACKACAMTYTGMQDGTCANAKSGSNPRTMCQDQTATNPCGQNGTCDGAGQCAKVRMGQSCGQASCPQASTFVPAGTCDGAGTCKPGTSMDCGIYPCAVTGCAKPCASATDCPATDYCASNGLCKTKKSLGDGCAGGGECGSGICSRDQVCCDKTCADVCTSCLKTNTGQSDGTCGSVQAGLNPRGECTTDGTTTCQHDGTCDGNGACHLYAQGTPCATSGTCSGSTFTPVKTCDGNGSCLSQGMPVNCGQAACAPDGCKTSCTTDSDCGSTGYCVLSSHLCTAKKANGMTCGAGNECTNNACIDGYCCNNGCSMKCYACSAAKTNGQNGACAPVAAGMQDADCTASAASTCGQDGACDGAGNCELWKNGTQCVAGMCNTSGNYLEPRTCNLGVCQPVVTDTCGAAACDNTNGCKRMCATNQDCVGNNYCDTTSKVCTGQKSLGQPCGNGFECLTGSCVDGVCCNNGCSGLCMSCKASQTGQASDGTCANITNGTDPASECASDGITCGKDGFCGGNGTCRFTPSGTMCGPSMCSMATFTAQSACDGNGTCKPGAQSSCNGFQCNPTGGTCKTSCTSDTTDCVSTSFCLNAVCTAKRGVGGGCSGNNYCSNNMCSSDGVCCSSACTASCQACSMANTGVATGTCLPRATTSREVATCVNACPNGYAICNPGAPYCGRTLWTFEDGVPANTGSSLEWNPGEAGLEYTMARAHTGMWSAKILSDPMNYNAGPNIYMCDVNTGLGIDLRGKSFKAWFLADGPSDPGAYCQFGTIDINGAQIDAFPGTPTMPANFNVTTFGSWYLVTYPFSTSSSAIANLFFQCYFGAWAGSLYFDDVSIN
jgi:hypothetical protein